MSKNNKAYDQEFKENVINYVLEHPEEKYTALGNKFGVHPTTIGGWMKQYRSNDNQVIVRGSGNYASDEAKEIAKLKKELKEHKGRVRSIKKSYWHNGQVKQREIYEADDQQKKKDQTISVASVLKTIGVSRSGFYSYKEK